MKSVGFKKTYFGKSHFGKSSFSKYPFGGSVGLSIPGLTAYHDFTKADANYLDYAVGSRAMTYTNAFSATTPGCYTRSDGVMEAVTTANARRRTMGYYSAGGIFVLAPGYLCEPSSTNYLLDSNFGRAIAADNWSSSYGTITDSTSLLFNISGAKRRRIDYTYLGTESSYSFFLNQTTANDSFNASGGTVYVTLSFWARGDLSGVTSGTGNHYWIACFGLDNSSVTTEYPFSRKFNQAVSDGLSSTDFHKFVFYFSLTNTNTRKIRFNIINIQSTSKPNAGENAWLEIEGVQIEKNQFGTSPIPTTTSVLTRNADVLTGLIANNRTANSETCVVKFIPLGGDFSILANRYLLSSETKDRLIKSSAVTSGKIIFNPNVTDSSGAVEKSTTSIAKNTAYVIAAVAVSPTGNPNTALYVNGVSESAGSPTTDWTSPAWGTNFYIGSDNAGANQFGGIIQKVAFFNRALSASEISVISKIL